MNTEQIIAGWIGALIATKVGLVLQKRLAGCPLVAFILSAALLLASDHIPSRSALNVGLGFFFAISAALTFGGAVAGARRQWRAVRAKAGRRKQII